MIEFLSQRAIVLGSYLALLTSQVGDTLMSGLTLKTVVVVILVRIFPLLLVVKAVYTDNARTLIWLCFIVLGYFIGAVLGTFSPKATPFDVLALLSSISLFLSAMFRARSVAMNNK